MSNAKNKKKFSIDIICRIADHYTMTPFAQELIDLIEHGQFPGIAVDPSVSIQSVITFALKFCDFMDKWDPERNDASAVTAVNKITSGLTAHVAPLVEAVKKAGTQP